MREPYEGRPSVATELPRPLVREGGQLTSHRRDRLGHFSGLAALGQPADLTDGLKDAEPGDQAGRPVRTRASVHNVDVPTRPIGRPAHFLDDDEHTRLLRRCLTDTDLPLDVRTAGALALLFGVTIRSVLQLAARDIDHRPDGTYLPLGTKPALPPPGLADLVAELATAPRGRSATWKGGAHTQLLFPGRHPGKPARPYSFTSKLNKHGIKLPEARNRARRSLAETLPAPVIADLFGMHIETAVRWTHLTQRDWTHYIAERAR